MVGCLATLDSRCLQGVLLKEPVVKELLLLLQGPRLKELLLLGLTPPCAKVAVVAALLQLLAALVSLLQGLPLPL